MKKWFDSWEWFKDSDRDWNFGRFVAWQLFMINTFALVILVARDGGFKDFDSMWSTIVGCSGFITGIIVYFIEIFCRERIKLKVKIGDKEFGVENEKDK